MTQITINLLPWRQRRRIRLGQQWLGGIAVLLLMSVACCRYWMIYLQDQHYGLTQQYQSAQAQLQEQCQRQQEQQQRRRVNAAKRRTQKVAVWLDQIGRRLPKAVVLQKINIDARHVTVVGVLPKSSQLSVMLQMLGKARVRSIHRTELGYDFRVEVML